MSTPVSDAGHIPVNDPGPIITYSPVVLDVPGRAVKLEVKVSAPETGRGRCARRPGQRRSVRVGVGELPGFADQVIDGDLALIDALAGPIAELDQQVHQRAKADAAPFVELGVMGRVQGLDGSIGGC